MAKTALPEENKPSFFSRLFGGHVLSDDEKESIDVFRAPASIETGSFGFAEAHLTNISESYSTDQETDDDENADEFNQNLRLRHTRACRLMKDGNIEQALNLFEVIFTSLSQRYGKDNHRVATGLHNVGIANLRAGKLENARQAMKEAVRVRKVTLDKTDPAVADSLVELGIILLSLKEFPDSILIFHEALDLREFDSQDLVLPLEVQESDLKIAKVLNNIGCVYFEQAEYDEASESFNEAIRLQKNALKTSLFSSSDPVSKPGYLTLASTLCNKGYIDLEQNHFSAAVDTFKESLKIQKDLLRLDDKLVLSTLDNLAYAYSMSGRFEKALTAYQELYDGQDESDQFSEKDSAMTLRNVIYTQAQLQKYSAALECLCTLEAIQMDVYGEESKPVRQTRRLMGQVNYQVLKFPTPLSGAWCACGAGSHGMGDEEVQLKLWAPMKPSNGSKMSGHRVACP